MQSTTSKGRDFNDLDRREFDWLQFFQRRLLAALRYAKVPETSDILRELISEVDGRLAELSGDQCLITSCTAFVRRR
jgi:hypothetical protein